jgi:2-iminobutanoate/2-iminopropanoate deaminase
MPSIVEGPYSPAVEVGNFVFVSGQTGYENKNTGEEVEGIENQTRQCMERIQDILQKLALSLENVIKVTIFLNNATDFKNMNSAYQNYFPERKPSRSTVVTNLVNPKMLIEIECIACRLPAEHHIS